jgi:hypothetical protein
MFKQFNKLLVRNVFTIIFLGNSKNRSYLKNTIEKKGSGNDNFKNLILRIVFLKKVKTNTVRLVRWIRFIIAHNDVETRITNLTYSFKQKFA